MPSAFRPAERAASAPQSRRGAVAVPPAEGGVPGGGVPAGGVPAGGVSESQAWGAGVVGALLIAMSGPFVRLSGAAPATSAVFRCVYALPALGLLAARERRRYGPRAEGSRRAAALAGVCFSADLLLWHHSIELVGAGLATVLANVQVVVVGVVAWVALGERPERRTMAAVPVVLTGVALIAGVTGGGYGRSPLLGALLGLGTAFAYSGFILLLRYANADPRRPAGPLADATVVAAVCIAAAGLVLGELDVVPSWPAHGWLLALALGSQVVAWLLISVSLPRLPALATSIVLLLQPVGSVLVGVAILDERPSAAQLVGVALVLLGVVVAGGRGRARADERRRAAAQADGAPTRADSQGSETSIR